MYLFFSYHYYSVIKQYFLISDKFTNMAIAYRILDFYINISALRF